MSKLNYPFEPVAQEDWVLQIQKELRDQADRITFTDDIEGLALNITQDPPFIPTISFQKKSGAMNCVHFERIQDEKESNRRMLLALMQGADSLFIRIEKEQVDWNMVFQQIELAYIHTDILIQDESQLISIKDQLSSDAFAQITLVNDIISHTAIDHCQSYFNGFELQQIGAYSMDELSTILCSYHQHLSNGNNGNVLFSVGLGNHYFVQIAKLRALHYLIQKLNRLHGLTSDNYRIHAHVGWLNKSLKDPHTNLLRQTTEGMAAYGGVADGIVIHPWDEYAKEGKDDFTLRMSININNLLSEEAHFNWVIDPMKGSRILEGLSTQLIEKTWLRIQKLSDMDESSMISSVLTEIEQTRQKRVSKWQQGEEKWIGINAYMNNEQSKAKTWGKLPSYLGKEYLIVEKNC